MFRPLQTAELDPKQGARHTDLELYHGLERRKGRRSFGRRRRSGWVRVSAVQRLRNKHERIRFI